MSPPSLFTLFNRYLTWFLLFQLPLDHLILFFLYTGQQNRASVENTVTGESMGALIVQPSGPAVANIVRMTLPLVATMYLDKTNQWDILDFEKREEALQHIKYGRLHLLMFRKSTLTEQSSLHRIQQLF